MSNSIISKIQEGKQDSRLAELTKLANKNGRDDILEAIAIRRIQLGIKNKQMAKYRANNKPSVSGRPSCLKGVAKMRQEIILDRIAKLG